MATVCPAFGFDLAFQDSDSLSSSLVAGLGLGGPRAGTRTLHSIPRSSAASRRGGPSSTRYLHRAGDVATGEDRSGARAHVHQRHLSHAPREFEHLYNRQPPHRTLRAAALLRPLPNR